MGEDRATEIARLAKRNSAMAEPPPRKKGHWQRYAHELAATPGEWKLVLENVPTVRAKSVGYQSLRHAGCETTLRFHGDEKADVWARWPIAEKNNHDGGDQ